MKRPPTIEQRINALPPTDTKANLQRLLHCFTMVVVQLANSEPMKARADATATACLMEKFAADLLKETT